MGIADWAGGRSLGRIPGGVARDTTLSRLAAALAAFALLALLGSFPAAHRWDEGVTVWLQRSVPNAAGPASIFSRLANVEVIIPATAVAAGLFLLRNRRLGIAAFWLVGALACASLIAVALKYLIVHPGPPRWLHLHELPRGLHGNAFGSHGSPADPPRSALRLHLEEPYSFPSGHATRITLLAVTTLRAYPWAAGLLILAVTAALVYRGVHWPSDLLGGVCLGWAVAEASALLRANRTSTRH